MDIFGNFQSNVDLLYSFYEWYLPFLTVPRHFGGKFVTFLIFELEKFERYFWKSQRICKRFNFLKIKYLKIKNFKDSFLKLFNSDNYLEAVGINSILGILVYVLC